MECPHDKSSVNKQHSCFPQGMVRKSVLVTRFGNMAARPTASEAASYFSVCCLVQCSSSSLRGKQMWLLPLALVIPSHSDA